MKNAIKLLDIPYKRIKYFFTFMFRIAGYELLELMNACVLSLGAVAILRPDNDIFSNGNTYRILAHVMNENTLGVLFLVLALYKITALLDGNLKFRQIISFVITGFWGMLFLFMLWGNPTGMLYLWVGLFAMISVIIAARLRVDIDNKIPPWTARV